jgi:hypothetical protein
MDFDASHYDPLYCAIAVKLLVRNQHTNEILYNPSEQAIVEFNQYRELEEREQFLRATNFDLPPQLMEADLG